MSEMLVFLIPTLSLLTGVLSLSNLPNYTQVKLGVVMDETWIRKYGATAQQMKEILASAVVTADESFEHGEIQMEFIESGRNPKYFGGDLTAILTLVDCQTAHHISSEMFQHSILHLSVTDLECQRMREETSFMIPMVERDNSIVQLLADLRFADTLIWKRFTVFYDDSITESVADSIHRVLSRSAATAMIRLAGTGQVQTLLSGVSAGSSGQHFLVISRQNMVKEFINTAKSNNLLGVDSEWLFVVTDTSSQDSDLSSLMDMGQDGCNIAFVINTSHAQDGDHCSSGIVCTVKEIISFLASSFESTLVEEMKMFSKVLSVDEWLIIKPSDQDRMVSVKEGIKERLRISGHCNKCTSWMIEAVEVREEDRINKLEVGTWTSSVGLLLKDDLFPHVTGVFRGRVIPVASIQYAPWMTYVHDAKGNVKYSGLIFALLDMIGTRLNFTYIVKEPADGLWGTNEDGEWNGMVKQLIDREVLIAAASFAVSQERQQVVNFTSSIDLQPYSFMYRRPKEISRAGIFIKPFTPFVWLCVTVVMLMMGPIIWIVHRNSYYYKHYDTVNEFGLFNMSNCVLYCYGAVLQQGGPTLPEANSGRLAVGFWWLFVMVIVVTYAGNLFAFLFSPQIEFPINTIEELLRKRNDEGISWGILGGSVIEQYLKSSEGDKFKILGEAAEKHTSAQTVADGEVFTKIKEQEHVYIEWLTKLQMMRKEQYRITGVCDYAFAQEDFFYERVAMAMPQDSPWINHFNKEIKSVFQAGLIGKWKQEFWPKEDECSLISGGGGSMQRVSITDLQGAFFTLLVGLLVGGLLFLCESMTKKKQDKRSSVQPFAADTT